MTNLWKNGDISINNLRLMDTWSIWKGRRYYWLNTNIWWLSLGLVQQHCMECRCVDMETVPGCRGALWVQQAAALQVHRTDDPYLLEPGPQCQGHRPQAFWNDQVSCIWFYYVIFFDLIYTLKFHKGCHWFQKQSEMRNCINTSRYFFKEMLKSLYKYF